MSVVSGIAVDDVYLVPLADGRAGLCRVLATTLSPPSVRVMTTAWIGEAAQASQALTRDPLARMPLRLTFHGHRGAAHVFWTVMPKPARFTKVGTLAPTAADLALPAKMNAWEACPNVLAAQWSWDHEREKFDAERKARAKERRADRAARLRALEIAAKARREAAKRAPPVDAAKCTRRLNALAKKRWFASWRGAMRAEVVTAARAIMIEAIEKALVRSRSAGADRRALTTATRAFNRLEARNEFVGTLEAETMHEALVALGEACGLDAETCAEAIDEVRDW